MNIGKNNRWCSKNKSCRGQQFYQPQQQQLQCSPKPVILFEQPSSSISPIPPSSTSFLVTSSTFTHGPLLKEHYNSSGMTLLPQSYFKPPEMQTFCMIQDRQNTQQQQPMHASYYNISATNTCSLQTVNTSTSFPLSNLNPYTSLTSFTNNQYPTSVQSSSIFTNPSVDLVFGAPPRDKPLSLECSPVKHNTSKISSISESRVVPINHNEKSNDWPLQTKISSGNSYEVPVAQTAAVEEESNKNIGFANCSIQKSISDVIKSDEEHYSDESSASFDFSIEAEKMVSALCNTTSSNDLSKEELKTDKTESTPLFNGAGDNVSNNKGWFTDLSPKESGTSIGIQTDGPCTDRSQYPELIRNTAYWGCIEAEIVINSDSSQTDSKRNWLTCLSSATRTAITKSSTCIPVFAGDRVFINDLISALLRVSNGWLSLDNYLNKQHFPNVLDRIDPEFIACFHTWEENTYELLKQIVQAFRKLEENNEVLNIEQKHKETYKSSSFPGDVSLYTDCDLFDPLSQYSLSQQNTNGKIASQQNLGVMPMSLSTNNLLNFEYDADQQKQQSSSHKESKLRSKWTITGNLSSLMNGTKSVPNVSIYHTEIGNIMSNKLRIRDTSSSLKLESTQKSLNAEFSRLRNKVMESNTSAIKQLRSKDNKQECMSESKFSRSRDNTESIRLQNSVMNTPISYNGLYAQNYLSFTFPLSTNPESLYHTPNSGLLMYGSHSYPSSETYSVIDSNLKSNKNHGYSCAINAKMNSPYVSKTPNDHVELPTVPKSKMTLLSQIEPRTIEKESKEMTANLSAWFASMRNAQLPAIVPTFQELRINENSTPRLFAQREIPKYSTSTIKQSQTDANRQFQALQNLQNIQSTPWAAGNFIGNHTQIQQVPEEYDSSEDVRVYMKPGSYNVPKKRHQRRSNRRSENNSNSRNVHTNNHHNMAGSKGKNILVPASSTPLSHINISTLSNINNATLIKTSFPPASQLPAPAFKLENSPRILRRVESLSSDNHQDVTWKAACASAEILLEALNVKDCTDISKKDDCNDDIGKNDSNEDNSAEPLLAILQQSLSKSMKPDDADCASSYEASEDDSESTCKLSPSTNFNLSIA